MGEGADRRQEDGGPSAGADDAAALTGDRAGPETFDGQARQLVDLCAECAAILGLTREEILDHSLPWLVHLRVTADRLTKMHQLRSLQVQHSNPQVLQQKLLRELNPPASAASAFKSLLARAKRR